MASDKISQQREDLQFKVLRLLKVPPDLSQRGIAEEVGMSLGAVIFCVKALVTNGYITLANFKASKNKIGCIHVLMPKRIAYRAKSDARFIERKVAQYKAMRQNWTIYTLSFLRMCATERARNNWQGESLILPALSAVRSLVML